MAQDTPEPWARRHAFVALDDRELAAMLRPLFGERRVESAEPLAGGFVNTNYRVRLAGLDDVFVLRSYVRDAGACQRERDIITRVQGRVPVAEVLYADTRGEAFGRPYAVMRWMEGVALDQLLARPAEADPVALAACLARTLAAIGSFTFPQIGFFRPELAIAEPLGSAREFCVNYLESCLFHDRAGERIGPDLTAELWPLLSANAHLLDVLGASAALVHSDYKGSNLLLLQASGRWEAAAAMDLEVAHAGTPLGDIGILLPYAATLPSDFAPTLAATHPSAGGSLSTP